MERAEGSGRVIKSGRVHLLDRNGSTFCGTARADVMLYDDLWIGDVGIEGVPASSSDVIDRATCLRCKLAAETKADNPPQKEK